MKIQYLFGKYFSGKRLTGPQIIGGLILLAVATAVFFALRSPPIEVELGQVTRGSLTVTVDDLGETRVRDLYAVSAPVTGQLLRVPLKPGTPVVPGVTILARIQPVEPDPLDARTTAQVQANIRSLTADLSAAQSRRTELQADKRLAEQELDRVEELFKRGFASRAALDRAKASRDAMTATVAQADDSIESTRQNLQASRAALITAGDPASGRGSVMITSPVPGFILRVPQESARVVAAGTPLVEVGDPKRLEIVTDLLSADAVQVRPGAPVLIDAWGGEQPLQGKVRLVEPYGFTKFSALGVEEQRVNVVIDFAEPRQAWQRLGHGYRATVRITIWSAKNVIRVPISALFRTGGHWSVFSVDSHGHARLKAVAIGRMNDEMAQVRQGLEPEDEVILHPGARIADGVKVRERPL